MENTKEKNGYAGAISLALLWWSCGSGDSDLTKLSKEHDDAVENIATQKEELKKAQEVLKEAQEKVEVEQQDLINAKQEEAELRIKLKQAKINPPKE